MPSITFITGMSGAGKTIALKTLEDIGYEAIDNLPLSIIPLLASNINSLAKPLAIGIDIRSRDFNADYFINHTLPSLKSANPNIYILFLESDDETLLRRFTETRRKHPISDDRPIIDSITNERELMQGIKDQANLVLDTSDYSLNELRNRIKTEFSNNKKKDLFVRINSFSFKKGVPRDSDLLFDMRFLKNPHYQENLRALNGKNQEIADYVESDPFFAPAYEKLKSFIELVLPRYIEESKIYLTISIGCTGGKHRSVFVAEKLFKDLHDKGYDISLHHRDIVSVN